MSNSPPVDGLVPNGRFRPISQPLPYSNFGGRMHTSPGTSRDRRASMYSQTGLRLDFNEHPPPPHMPQAHFNRRQNIDFDLDMQRNGKLPGSNGYACVFDSLSFAGDVPSSHTWNVLLIGSEGSLNVYKVDQKEPSLVGQINGLRGGVLGAKIIPWSDKNDPDRDFRPFVALIVHGIMLPDERDRDDDTAITDSLSSLRGPESVFGLSQYQTSVEIYSLRTSQHITTLYKSPPVNISTAYTDSLFTPPPPVGDLRVDASGRFIIVISGVSGELHIFAHTSKDETGPASRFHCIGKVWTTLQYREQSSSSSSSSSSEPNSPTADVPTRISVPLYSLNQRSLVVVPPNSASCQPVNGTVLKSRTFPKPPYVDNHVAPPPPNNTCGVEMPDDDSLLNRAVRNFSQEAMKVASWAVGQGFSAVKQYLNKSSSKNPSMMPPDHYPSGPSGLDPQRFPPVNPMFQSVSTAARDPPLVSIYDLHRLICNQTVRHKNALAPVATFQPPLGCSHLALGPSGRMLVTVSAKGDIQFVWDLMNIRKEGKGANAPTVRMVQKFSRVTVTNIVDATWSYPIESKLALLTDKGTVHTYALKLSASNWPPPRRHRQSLSRLPSQRPGNNESEIRRSAVGSVTSAFGALRDTSRRSVDALRSRSSSNGPGIASGLSMAPAAGARSGKALAAGLSKSVGEATFNSVYHIRHAEDNKLRLDISEDGVAPGRIKFMIGKEVGFIGTVGAGTVQLHVFSVQDVATKGKSQGQSVVITKKNAVSFKLPRLPNLMFPPAIEAILDEPPHVQAAFRLNTAGSWSFRVPGTRYAANKHLYPALSYAEIESTPAYQPFHTDARIALSSYDSGSSIGSNSHLSPPGLWTFGDNISETTVVSGAPGPLLGEPGGSTMGESGAASGVDGGAPVASVVTGVEQGMEGIVVTTRRTRRAGAGENEDGFFEDDMDVVDFADERV
ncbi:hypothetical protein M501DRAFT_937003 [Patellaria atrata CBS 101060]|uniref:BCAS3 domain-containing protein n=1 Tax=Patellaria atrata CBS 101060 TaxID=1346257 RepID=A0A9P4S859_9PEZI|nr:hypothetical protein M501DRAFT_937003 [Patellaria atrata CBS 101060]